MSDYFIAPIQRIPRYCLLLKGIAHRMYIFLLAVFILRYVDLQKYTNPMDDHHDALDKAIKVLTGLAMAMDHVQSKMPQ